MGNVGEKDGISESYKKANIIALDDYFDDDDDHDNTDETTRLLVNVVN
jgi:hypothetical protein